jgi:hypothetical protein
MKRAILIGFVAMAPVAGCGSDGTPRRGGPLADPVGGQSPLTDPQNPAENSQNPLFDPTNPLPDPQNPSGGPATSGSSGLDCTTLCSSIVRCATSCATVCGRVKTLAETGACASLVRSYLDCTGITGFVCDGRGRVSPQTINDCAAALGQVNGCLMSITRASSPAGDTTNNPNPAQ